MHYLRSYPIKENKTITIRISHDSSKHKMLMNLIHLHLTKCIDPYVLSVVDKLNPCTYCALLISCNLPI